MTLRTKRIYDPAEASDGRRILVDAMWPRGMSRERARIEQWAREAAPSAELRKWYRHDPERWDEFLRRYFRELDTRGPVFEGWFDSGTDAVITLLYAASDRRRNNAVALKQYLENRLERGGS